MAFPQFPQKSVPTESYSEHDVIEVMRLFTQKHLRLMSLLDLPRRDDVFSASGSSLDECAEIIWNRIAEARGLDDTRSSLGTPANRPEKKFQQTPTFSPTFRAQARCDPRDLGAAGEGSALDLSALGAEPLYVATPEKRDNSASSEYVPSPKLTQLKTAVPRRGFSYERASSYDPVAAKARAEPSVPADVGHGKRAQDWVPPLKTSTPKVKRSEEEEFNDAPSPRTRYMAKLPNFPHVTAPVRKKAERKQLHGVTCKDCVDWYLAGPEHLRTELINRCSKHRVTYAKGHESPKVPWLVTMDSEPIDTQPDEPLVWTREYRAALKKKVKQNLDSKL
jgi:hypothetical protein